MEEEVRICDYCGRVLAEEEGTPVDDELLCDDCVEEHCVTCDHCGETIWEQNSVSDEDTCLCQDCFDAHYALATLVGILAGVVVYGVLVVALRILRADRSGKHRLLAQRLALLRKMLRRV